MNEVKDIIRMRRKSLGLTLEDVAEKVNVNASTVMRWESGDIDNMKRDKIASLAEVLKISPAVIMGWDAPIETVKVTIDQNPLYHSKDVDKKTTQKIDRIVTKLEALPEANRDYLLDIIESMLNVGSKDDDKKEG